MLENIVHKDLPCMIILNKKYKFKINDQGQNVDVCIILIEYLKIVVYNNMYLFNEMLLDYIT